MWFPLTPEKMPKWTTSTHDSRGGKKDKMMTSVVLLMIFFLDASIQNINVTGVGGNLAITVAEITYSEVHLFDLEGCFFSACVSA